MKRIRLLLILQAAVCVLLVIFLAAGAVCICRDGLARKAENPLESIYTPENAAKMFAAAVPLAAAFLLLLVIGLVTGAKDQKADQPAGPAAPVKPEPGLKHRKTVQAAIVVTAVLLIAAGILNGSAGDVLVKAIHICTECIGLG